MRNILPKLDRWLSGRECPKGFAEKNFGSFLSFDKAWFGKRQNVLLWLLNKPIIKYITRWFLHIDEKEKIEAILPNATFTAKGNKVRGDFRTHPKYAKRIYYSLFPMWWTMHFLDWLFMEKYMPQYHLNCGTLTAFPDPDPETNTVDGSAGESYGVGTGQLAWATIIGNAGNFSDDAANFVRCVQITSDNTTDKFRGNFRGITLFDTSSIGVSNSIDDATLSLYGERKIDNTGNGIDVNIYSSAPASDTAIANGDYDSFGSTAFSTAITITNWSLSAYNDFTLNASGEAAIIKDGISKLGTRNANFDVAAVAPTWFSDNTDWMFCWGADQTGTTQDPKLVVNFSTAATFTPRLVIF